MNTSGVTRPKMESSEARCITLFICICGLDGSLIYGLAGILADNPLGDGSDRHSSGAGAPACLLDRLLALALEVSGRGSCRVAHRSAADGARVLRADRAGTAQPF